MVSWVGKNFDLCLLICFISLLIVGCLRGLLVLVEFIFFLFGLILGLLWWVVLMLLVCDSIICDRYIYYELRFLYL